MSVEVYPSQSYDITILNIGSLRCHFPRLSPHIKMCARVVKLYPYTKHNSLIHVDFLDISSFVVPSGIRYTLLGVIPSSFTILTTSTQSPGSFKTNFK